MLCRNGTFGVRIMCTIRVWVSRPTTNQPDWNRPGAAVRASNTYHISAKQVRSKIELIGPKNTMKRPMSAGFHFSGLRTSLVHVVERNGDLRDVVQQVLHQQLQRQHRQERQEEATSTENTLPKLELAVMRMYLSACC